jgi:hypothetical protein
LWKPKDDRGRHLLSRKGLRLTFSTAKGLAVTVRSTDRSRRSGKDLLRTLRTDTISRRFLCFMSARHMRPMDTIDSPRPGLSCARGRGRHGTTDGHLKQTDTPLPCRTRYYQRAVQDTGYNSIDVLPLCRARNSTGYRPASSCCRILLSWMSRFLLAMRSSSNLPGLQNQLSRCKSCSQYS